eukprot:c9537_g1_i5.p1 GENE.c9537_g1_i5~~c9537_g1_i5.p1  ORF type:complete len:118 (-),score=12.85 c9537_g1_i5:271-624(-)
MNRLSCSITTKHSLTVGESGVLQANESTREVIVKSFASESKTPLHYAAEGGHLNVCLILVAYGADISLEDVSSLRIFILSFTFSENAKIILEQGDGKVIETSEYDRIKFIYNGIRHP